MVQLWPVHPFSHVHVFGRVQLPLFGHLRYCGYVSPGKGGGGNAAVGFPTFTPLARNKVPWTPGASYTVNVVW
jgi:hypothetical protein